MSIIAKNTSQPRELIPTGMYQARCVKLIEIGTCTENVMGSIKQLAKVNFSWEIPSLTKVFDEAKGPQPLMLSKEFTVSMGTKANLRKALESWRGKPFTDEEASGFDITVLLGKPCLLNVTHKPSAKDPSNVYEEISAITPPMAGMTILPQVNPSIELSYDKWDEKLFEALPDFIKTKMRATPEYQAMKNPIAPLIDDKGQPVVSDLPWDVTPVETEPLF